MELIRENLPLVLVAVAILLLLAFLLLRPKQRVRLSNEEAPVRPHMAHPDKPKGEGQGLVAEAAAAIGDVTGEIIEAPVHENLPGASGPPDDLTRLKGVGPKFAGLLNELGITRFEQLARLSEAEIERLDRQLGPFRGRLERDQIPLQADYLARVDIEGFELRFGKL